ncbi:MAG: FecR domain-containing protein [Planctomycetota bacterium]
MSDPDLITYLDGEADAETTQLMEARLRAEPALRREALAYMRQRVVLSRVLPKLVAKKKSGSRRASAKSPSQRSRRWWLAAATVATAAGIAVVVSVTNTRSIAPPFPEVAERPTQPETISAPHRPVVTHIRLADGGSWRVGELIENTGRNVTKTLSDGTEISLGSDTALLVGAPDQPWQLKRGNVRVAVPAGAESLSGGVHTPQAEVHLQPGLFEIGANAEGSIVGVVKGGATIRDTIVALTTVLHPGPGVWIPSDTAAPQTEMGAQGTVRGIVESAHLGNLQLRTRFGVFPFTPVWHNSAPKGWDRDMTARINRLRVGDRVKIGWAWEEHLRVISIYVISPGGKNPLIMLSPEKQEQIKKDDF